MSGKCIAVRRHDLRGFPRPARGVREEQTSGGMQHLKRLDRYLLSQLMALFGFFALVLVSVYWVNRAVLLFDKLIADGQTAWVVLEFTALTLPNVIRLVLPVAAFAATLYTLNQLSSESELVVMQATGASPWRLARPVAVFGLIVAGLMVVLVHVLVPASKARLTARQVQISENVTARFLIEGSFQHPAAGVTIYIRQISELGELLDVFLVDARTPAMQMTYTAEKALIVPSASGPKLIMFEGMAQGLRRADGALSITRFADFTYDVGALIAGSSLDRLDLDEISSWQLISPSPALLTAAKASPEQARQVLHDRIAQPLLAPVSALLGAAALMLGGFSRFGLWRQAGLAIGALIGLQALSNATASSMRGAPELWPLSYLPAAVGLVAVALMLWLAGRPRHLRPKARRAAA